MLYTAEEFDCFAPVTNKEIEADFLKIEEAVNQQRIQSNKDWGSENLSDQDIVDLLLEEQKMGWKLSDSDLAFISRVRGVK